MIKKMNQVTSIVEISINAMAPILDGCVAKVFMKTTEELKILKVATF